MWLDADTHRAIGADFIDESEVLTPADNLYHIDKTKFKLPFVCGAKNIGEAMRRIHEGASNSFIIITHDSLAHDSLTHDSLAHDSLAHDSRVRLRVSKMVPTITMRELLERKTRLKSRIKRFTTHEPISFMVVLFYFQAAMIRTKGAAGTGDVVQAVTHHRTIEGDIRHLQGMDEKELNQLASKERVPLALVKEIKKLGRLPVVNFAAGGVATPADAALMMQLGSDGVFVGSGAHPFTHDGSTFFCTRCFLTR